MTALWRNGRVRFGASVLLFFVFVAVLAPLIVPTDPDAADSAARLADPSRVHWLGTDDLGRDVLSRLIMGSRLTLLVSVPAVLLAGIIGVSLGILAGYRRGLLEAVIMRACEVVMSFPPIALAIMAVGLLGSSILNLVVIIGILFAPTFVRIAHSTTLVRSRDLYVEAAHALGAGPVRIMVKAILPNIAAVVAVQASISLGQAILLESSLSFLGLGPPPPDPSWGRMVGRARTFMVFQPWLVVWPSIAIALTIVAANHLGDGLRDVLDKRTVRR